MGDRNRTRKLKWLCRRGMKELDILLERFIQAHETELEDGGWPEFERLLQAEDDVLWDWLQAPDRADAEEFQPLLEAVRGHHA